MLVVVLVDLLLNTVNVIASWDNLYNTGIYVHCGLYSIIVDRSNCYNIVQETYHSCLYIRSYLVRFTNVSMFKGCYCFL